MTSRAKILMTAAAAMMATSASATTVLYDNFSGENGGSDALNYSGFSNFGVVAGSVDLVHTDDGYGITCFAGSACVNLDGTAALGGGILVSTQQYAFNANDLVTLTVHASGNQRSAATAGDDTLLLGFNTSGISTITYVALTGFPDAPPADTPFSQDPTGDGFGYDSDPDTLASTQGFQTYSISFRAAQGGSISGVIGTDSSDGQGPILGDVQLDVAAVPEPATWVMMALGVGAVGYAMRRRQKISTRISYAV